jgi:fatty acid desaturase
MSGNLSHQIEHHLFPDLPAHRYGELAVEVREICERYGLPYNAGPLHKQFGSVVKKICKLALPGRGGDEGPQEPPVELKPRTRRDGERVPVAA